MLMPRCFTSLRVASTLLLVTGLLRADPTEDALKVGLEALDKGDRTAAATTFVNAFNERAAARTEKDGTCMLLIASAGRLFADGGKADVAATCFERLYAISLALNGPSHPDTITIGVHLAHYLGRAGMNTEMAKRLCVEGMVASQLNPEIPGHVHLRALYTRADILLAEKDRIAAALAFRDFLKHAHAMRNPPQTVIANVYFNLGTIDSFFGRAKDAQAQFKNAFASLKKGRGDMGIDALSLRLAIADQLSAAEAVEVLKEIVNDVGSVAGVKSNTSLQQVLCSSEFKLAIKESEIGQTDGLVARLRSAIAHGIAGYGEDHDQLLQLYLQLAKLHLSKRQNKEGVECYRHVLAIRKKALGPDHESVAVTQKILDDLIEDLKKSGEL